MTLLVHSLRRETLKSYGRGVHGSQGTQNERGGLEEHVEVELNESWGWGRRVRKATCELEVVDEGQEAFRKVLYEGGGSVICCDQDCAVFLPDAQTTKQADHRTLREAKLASGRAT